MASADEIRTGGVVGAGAIGVSWAALLLENGLRAVVTDPAEGARDRLLRLLTPMLSRPDEALERLDFVDDLHEVAAVADVVFEAGPERLEFKQRLFATLDELTRPDVVLASSTSGLAASDIQRDCAHPERVLVAHPFNPPHLVPLVEVVGGRATSEDAVTSMVETLRWLGKQPIRLRRELPGHVANRLQAALWREAYFLVEQGVVSVADLDQAVAAGPGLRWALLGPVATQHLSGGEGGLSHVLEHLGPPMVEWWTSLGNPELTPELVRQLVDGVRAELDGDEVGVLARRDQALRELLETKSRWGLT